MQENPNVVVETTPNVEVTPTATQPVAEAPVSANGNSGSRTFTESQVTDLMKRRVAKSHQSFFKRYGVNNLDELDALFQKTHDYDNLNREFEDHKSKYNEIFEENSFLKNNINPDRYDDIRTYFKGKGIDFSNESLLEAIKTHPEWVNPSASTTIKTLGVEEHKKTPEIDERKLASKFLGVDL